MKTKNEKVLLNLVVLSAVATAVITVFVPVICWDQSEVLENSGIEHPELYCTLGYSTLSFKYYSIYDYRDKNSLSEYHRYGFLGFAIFESGNQDLTKEFSVITDYDIKDSSFFSQSVMSMLDAVIPIVWLIFLAYFCYKALRGTSQNKQVYFLYAGLVTLLMLIVKIIGVYLTFEYIDINNQGFTSGLSFGYGFYILTVSIILFFTMFIVQNCFLDRTEKT